MTAHGLTAPQLFQTFFHGRFSALETTCLRSFVDHGHRVRVYAYDHTTTPFFCERADPRPLLPEDRLFCYRTGFGAGSVSAFSNLFRYTLLLQHGGWWIDTDVACLSPAWPQSDIVAGVEDQAKIGTAILRFPAGHPVMAEAAATCRAAGETVRWGETGPKLLTRLLREHGLAHAALPSSVLYPAHWSEWLDLIDPACGEPMRRRLDGAVAVHLWNEMFRQHGFQRHVAPPPGSILHDLARRHGATAGFLAADDRTLECHIALARAYESIRSPHESPALHVAALSEAFS